VSPRKVTGNEKSFTFSSLYPDAVFFIAGCAISFLCRYLYTMKQPKPRLVWGSTPLINYVYWSRAMKHAGFFSQTFTYDPYPKFIENEWDVILSKKYGNIPIFAKMILAFFEAMTRYDVFFLSFDGFFLDKHHTGGWRVFF